MTNLSLVPAVAPSITFTVETRPSCLTGHGWCAVLTYRGKEYTELLPFDLPALTEEESDKVVDDALVRLQAQLKPVLEAEDAPDDDGPGAA